MTHRIACLLLNLVLLGGCGEPGIVEDPAAAPAEPEPAVPAEPRDFAITPQHSALSVSARMATAASATTTLVVTGGSARLEDDALSALELTLGDMELPSGTVVTDIRLSLVSFEPILEADPVRLSEHTVAGVATLGLDWALQTDRGPYQLQSQTITGVDLVVDLAGTSDLLVDLHRAGSFWSWADLFELGDLAATLHGTGQPVE